MADDRLKQFALKLRDEVQTLAARLSQVEKIRAVARDGRDGAPGVIMHRFPTDGMLSERTHVGSAVLPMRAECGHASCEVQSGSWNAQTYGNDGGVQQAPYFASGDRSVPGDPTPQPLVAFRSKQTLGAFPSKVRSKLVQAEFSTGSIGLYRIEVYRFPPGTLVSGAFTDVSTFAAIEQNDTFTEAAASGRLIFSKDLAVSGAVASVNQVVVDSRALGLVASPGDEFGIYKREIIAGAGDDTTTWSLAIDDLL